MITNFYTTFGKISECGSLLPRFSQNFFSFQTLSL